MKLNKFAPFILLTIMAVLIAACGPQTDEPTEATIDDPTPTLETIEDTEPTIDPDAMPTMTDATLGEDDTDTTEGDAELDTADMEAAETNLTGMISGAVEQELSMNASFACVDAETYELVANDGAQQLYVSLPAAGEAGSYEMTGSADAIAGPGQAYYISYTTEDDVTYDAGTGQIVIDSVPTAAGETFSGNITAELSDGGSESISVDAAFSIEAIDATFECE